MVLFLLSIETIKQYHNLNKSLNNTYCFGKIVEREIMKTKVEYLDALEIELKYLRPKVRKTIMARYMNKINVELDFGIEETRIIEKMPSPSMVAGMIYKEYGIDLSKKQNQSMSTYALISTIIGTILFVLLISAAIITYIYFFEIFIQFLSLFKQSIQFELLDAFISTMNFTVFLCLSLFVGVFIYELMLYLFIEIIERILLAYPNVNKNKFQFLGNLSIIKHINQIFHKSNKLFSKSIALLILLFVILSTTSFITKGYMYRVLMDLPSNKEIYIVDTNTLVTINIVSEIDELKWIIKESDSQELKIEYIYEFNRNFDFFFQENTLHINLDSQKKYDIFDLLKEPTHQIIVHVPSSIQVSQFQVSSKQSSLHVSNLMIHQLEFISNRGQLLIDNVSSTEITTTTNTGAIQIKDSSIDNLKITIESATLLIQKTTFITADISNQYGKIIIEEFDGTSFLFDNGGGKSELFDSTIEQITYQSRNGSIKIQNGITNSLIIETIATNQIDIYQGTYQTINIASEKGAASIEETTIIEDVSITGTEFFISIIESTMNNLYTETIGGATGIRDTQVVENIIIRLSQGDVTIVNVEAQMVDTSLVRGIVSYNNLYADHVKVYMESGDFSYDNNDLSRTINILEIVTNQANRRINVGS
jgi:DUF4097 and DUF4098 domain-containing protein YvlB